jgi:hypothetical protein
MNRTHRQTHRQTTRGNKRKQQVRSRNILYGGIILGILAVIAIAWLSGSNFFGPGGLMGDEVPIQSRAHLPSDAPPDPYNSNPPAGGAHFATDFQTKFYLDSDLAALPKYPEGYLVHNLEHGYVIFWYNCQSPNTDCSALKQTIQKVMDDTGGTKLIAFPWKDMTEPLVMTSWGRILRFKNPDPVQMKLFVERNRYQAPEPDAP